MTRRMFDHVGCFRSWRPPWCGRAILSQKGAQAS
jgi:hypothetical protein